MQTILGSGGVIGNELAKLLPNHTDKIRLVSRNPLTVTGNEELFKADIADENQTAGAIKGSDVVYLTAGLQYNIKTWQSLWPKIMDNVIKGCQKHNTKLVFFDNVYMYGKVNGAMTEETPHNPVSKKGEVRARIAERLMDEVAKGNITALIARAADFYGPGAVNTFIQPMVFEKLKNGKKASWLGRDDVAHSFTYTPDAGKATALLGNTPGAYNQIWHLPTHKDALTGKKFIEMVAGVCDVNPKYSVLTRRMMKMAGWFNAMAKESYEMMYQYEYEYLFDSTKFEKAFFYPVEYRDGIAEVVRSL